MKHLAPSLTQVWLLGLLILFIIIRVAADPGMTSPRCVAHYGEGTAYECPKDHR